MRCSTGRMKGELHGRERGRPVDVRECSRSEDKEERAVLQYTGTEFKYYRRCEGHFIMKNAGGLAKPHPFLPSSVVYWSVRSDVYRVWRCIPPPPLGRFCKLDCSTTKGVPMPNEIRLREALGEMFSTPRPSWHRLYPSCRHIDHGKSAQGGAICDILRPMR